MDPWSKLELQLLRLMHKPDEYKSALDTLYSDGDLDLVHRVQPVMDMVYSLAPEHLAELLSCPYKVVRIEAELRLESLKRRFELDV